MAMETSWLRLLLMLAASYCHVSVLGITDSKDASVLRSLKDQWLHTPPTWDGNDDPCGSRWEGISCTNSRVTALSLISMGLQGQLNGDIGDLSELKTLDLSSNSGLKGPVSAMIGNLKNLNILILSGCSFTGRIPSEIGNLKKLTFLALNTNNFTGEIPPSLGALSNLFWLDLAENQLSGSIPVSTPAAPGLDLLHNAKHFHFNKNKLSGNIPSKLFSSEMQLIHILFDGNQLNGEIPSTLGLVQTLEVLRLDKNSLAGEVPSSLQNLKHVIQLNLANNKLTGPIPDLTEMSSLNYVDLSNNHFDQSEAPVWFSTITSLTTLVMEDASLEGPIPQNLFSFPQLQEVRLKKNSFNSTLSMGDSVSQQLQLVDLEDNQITSVMVGSSYKKALKLFGNPVCNDNIVLSAIEFCRKPQGHSYSAVPYSTSYAKCANEICPNGQSLNPQSCDCAFPYEGTLYFRAPYFRDLSNISRFQSLEQELWLKLGLSRGSVSIKNLFFDTDDYIQAHLELFPSGEYFNRSEILRIGFDLTNQTFKPPPEFGPYYFIALQYPFPDRGRTSLSPVLIIGIAIPCALLILVIFGVGTYAFRQKKRAERAIKLNQPFASWGSTAKECGKPPQLKGARCFSYKELKSCTNNFSENNEIGSGGYGKVYKGVLPDQQIIAIKRAKQESMQGGLEFKTEIELLSRVHHRNLVGLIGFCFEQEEQMLVYEYIPNGTLRDCLSGQSEVHLNWKGRLRVALCSARGLAYLHELADPPIIHRDVKSANILLDDNLGAKVADFGLSKLVADCSGGYISTQVKGTLGYMDPEYYQTQQLSEKSDVYSFGVVMLELITAKKPIDKGRYIVNEVRMAMNRDDECYGLSKMIDPAILHEANLVGFSMFLELALQCVKENGTDRPTMSDVVKEIEAILQKHGVSSVPNSTFSSATDHGARKDALKHPYIDTAPQKKEVIDAFDYSGGYTVAAEVEPK